MKQWSKDLAVKIQHLREWGCRVMPKGYFLSTTLMPPCSMMLVKCDSKGNQNLGYLMYELLEDLTVDQVCQIFLTKIDDYEKHRYSPFCISGEPKC